MPVLIVSLNTWPHVGFSRKRSIEPSSRVMTMPNSSGFLHRFQADGGERLLLVVELDDLAEVEVGEDVAGDDQEALSELLAGVEHRAGGAEWRLLGGVHHPHTELRAVAEVCADGLRKEGEGDN